MVELDAVHAVRAAMDLQQQRILFGCIEIRGLDDPALHGLASKES